MSDNGASNIIKDLIISILIVSSIVLILSIVFYDKISLSKIVPESEEYVLSEGMQEGINQNKIEEADEVAISYYLDAKDMRKYEKANEYVKGKKDPFAEVSIATNDVNVTTSTKFYDDKGIK